jgi:spermidine synthase
MVTFPSLIIPKILYQTESKYNGKIDVFEVGKTRKIRVGGIYQSLNWESPACKSLVWGKAADLLKREEPELNNVMILGLGGGTMQHLISKNYEKSPYIVSVEIDSVMIDVARQYFDLDQIPNHKVINADAFAVVVDPADYDLSKNSFQALIVDIYIGEQYPDLGGSGNFIAAVRDMVVPGGLIIFNRIYINTHQEDVDSFIESISGFLHDVKSEIVAGYTNSDNILIYGRTMVH